MVVAKDPFNRHKKRLCIDYSQTINQYADLDACLLPRTDDMVNDLAGYEVYSTFDLNSAYHQVPIKESDRKYTGLEANGRLYQFCCIAFGVTNGVAVFQRAMDKMVDEEGLKDTFPYLDNITAAGRNQQEHDANVKKFHEAIQQRSLVLPSMKPSLWNLKHLSTYLVTVWAMASSNQIRSDFTPSRTILLQQMSALSVEWWACLLTMRSGYQTSLTRYSLL